MSIMNLLTIVPIPVRVSGNVPVEGFLTVIISINIIAAFAFLAWLIIINKRGRKLSAENIFDMDSQPVTIGLMLYFAAVVDFTAIIALLAVIIENLLF